MFEVVLYEPEIPANTGNIIRLCANVGARLHLIRPLGFVLDDKRLRRAGLDYHEWVNVKAHGSLPEFQAAVGPPRMFALSTKGARLFAAADYQPGDALLFGPETRGLPDRVLAGIGPDRCLYLPMQAHSRSLNLANAVAVVLYQAWQRQGFAGAPLK